MLAPRYHAFRASIRERASDKRLVVAGLAAIGSMAWTQPASSQVAANVTIQSNQMFRGETISADDPGLTVAASVDLPHGFYAGADASIAAGNRGLRVTASNQYIGISKRIGETSVDMGVVHREYGPIFDTAYRRSFNEIFAGVTLRKLQLRAFLSPDYLVDGRNTYYIEANARILSAGDWGLDGHAGLALIPHDLGDPRTGLIAYRDWSLNASRPVGKFKLNLGVAATNYPVFGSSGKARVSASISRSF